MASITLKEITHSYTAESENPDDFALKNRGRNKEEILLFSVCATPSFEGES